MNIEDIILGRRAIRKFTSENVEKELIDKIIEAGIWAPSGGNAQARVFIVISDPNKIRNVRNYSPGILGIPPLLIVLGTDQNKAQKYGGTDWKVAAIMDVAMAAENMMLRAYELGIGSCPILSFDENRTKKELSVPKHVCLDLLVTFGRSAYNGKAPKRFDTLIYFEEFGKKYEGNIIKNIELEIKKQVIFEREQILDLLTYMIFSAKNLSKEPKEYGIFRLLELAGRILDNYPDIEKNENFIKIKDKLDSLRFGEMKSEEQMEKELEDLSKLL